MIRWMVSLIVCALCVGVVDTAMARGADVRRGSPSKQDRGEPVLLTPAERALRLRIVGTQLDTIEGRLHHWRKRSIPPLLLVAGGGLVTLVGVVGVSVLPRFLEVYQRPSYIHVSLAVGASLAALGLAGMIVGSVMYTPFERKIRPLATEQDELATYRRWLRQYKSPVPRQTTTQLPGSSSTHLSQAGASFSMSFAL